MLMHLAGQAVAQRKQAVQRTERAKHASNHGEPHASACGDGGFRGAIGGAEGAKRPSTARAPRTSMSPRRASDLHPELLETELQHIHQPSPSLGEARGLKQRL